MDRLLEVLNAFLAESEAQYKVAQETDDRFYKTFYLGQSVGIQILRDRILIEELRLRNKVL
ncbi:hypothetical protein [Chroococcidiopsis sp.]|uniref:hypothetical protein n=1 Tax=Chroococcidiopsis sp. TaxID=3088168 RepID=UPI003F343884